MSYSLPAIYKVVKFKYSKIFYFSKRENGIVKVEGDVFYIAAVGKYPLSDKFEVFGKLGYGFWDIESDIRDDDGSDIMWGIGASWKINRKTSIVADYTVFDFDGDDAEVLAIGFKFNLQ